MRERAGESEDRVLTSHSSNRLGARDLQQHGPGIVGGDAVAEPSDPGAPGSRRGLSGAFVRGYESMRHPCESRHDHAEGYSVGETDTGGLGRVGMMMMMCWLQVCVAFSLVCCYDFGTKRRCSGVLLCIWWRGWDFDTFGRHFGALQGNWTVAVAQ